MTNKFCEQNPFACDNNGSNRRIYDDCYYKQQLHDSVNPFFYMMYEGKHENCNKCRKDKFYHPYDLVDVESELRNQTRPLSACGGWKYNPNTKRPACQTTKSQPIKFESPFTNYIYHDNPTEKLIGHYYKMNQPNIENKESKTTETTETTETTKPSTVEGFKNTYEKPMRVDNPMISQPIKCMNSDTCTCNLHGFSTFDESVPVVYPPELCPIVFNNIKKPTNPGYFIPNYI